MQTAVQRELRTIATELIREMNKITGITTADQARRLNLHKGNVAACINQGRIQALGRDTIDSLLRMYGFEFGEKEISIRESEACPVFHPRPLTDEMKNGLKAVVNRLRSLGLQCSFRPFNVETVVYEIYQLGGILFATDGEKRIWACVALNSEKDGDLVPLFEELGCVINPPVPIREDAIESWLDSAPHRSELLKYWMTRSTYDGMGPDLQWLDSTGKLVFWP